MEGHFTSNQELAVGPGNHRESTPSKVPLLGWGFRPSTLAETSSFCSWQLGVLCLGLLQDGDIRVGVVPQSQEILIRRLGLGRVALQHVSATKLQTRESANRSVQYDSAMVENFLELSRGFFALMGGQIGFSADIDRIQGRPFEGAVSRPSQLIRQGGSEVLQGFISISLADRKLCAE